MTLTTDPRDAMGRVSVSHTDSAKRNALIGRVARHVIQPETDPSSRQEVHARITRIVSSNPYARIIPPTDNATDYPASLIGRTVILDSVVDLLDCPSCGYTAGHWQYCPRSFDVLVKDQHLHDIVIRFMAEDMLASYEESRAHEYAEVIDARIPGATERTASYATGMHMSSIDIIAWAGAQWEHCLRVMLGIID